jgi:hypothetical protein
MSEQQANQIRNLVTLALEKHGVRAASFAQHEALKARNEGDAERATTWQEVARLAEEALRSPPDD